MKGAPETPNVVEACNLEGRQERLDGLLSQLEMCEKALQVRHGAASHQHMYHLITQHCQHGMCCLHHGCRVAHMGINADN